MRQESWSHKAPALPSSFCFASLSLAKFADFFLLNSSRASRMRVYWDLTWVSWTIIISLSSCVWSSRSRTLSPSSMTRSWSSFALDFATSNSWIALSRSSCLPWRLRAHWFFALARVWAFSLTTTSSSRIKQPSSSDSATRLSSLTWKWTH